MSCRILSPTDSASWHGVETAAWYWLWSGALCLLVVPAARGYSPSLGWVGYWLVGAPLVMLTALHQWRFMARLRSLLLIRAQLRHGSGGVTAGCRHAWRQGWRPAWSGIEPPQLRISALFSL